MLFTLVLAATLLSGPLARAVQPDEMLPDPAMEARARAISKDLRCLVCQNQSIDDSDAPLARDLRLLLRERLVKGDTDAQAVAFLTDRYGDYVLLRPPVKPATYLLWFGPFALLLAGGGLLLWRGRQGGKGRAEAVAPPLTAEEKAQVALLLRDEDEGKGRP
ncbi:cytochrome c-type biogenesis protein [Azospirillum sp. B4]|uniref:cytochrome c-type biogenesis protein n=1 Tax=Azospirillum sp. B4 TaxID=95605 RepID=UPI000346D558|nr:cytochrome c-type biogenesis protein [Azospirillum sp. B4]